MLVIRHASQQNWCIKLLVATARIFNFKVRACVILGFRREVDEVCTLQGYYTAYGGSPLPTFRDNLSVPSSRVTNSLEDETDRLSWKSVMNYHHTLRNIPEERRSQGQY